MDSFTEFYHSIAWFIPLIIICVLWDVVWKLIAMWKAARNNDLAWFICIALLNTMGLIPIIYILLFGNKSGKYNALIKNNEGENSEEVKS